MPVAIITKRATQLRINAALSHRRQPRAPRLTTTIAPATKPSSEPRDWVGTTATTNSTAMPVQNTRRAKLPTESHRASGKVVQRTAPKSLGSSEMPTD